MRDSFLLQKLYLKTFMKKVKKQVITVVYAALGVAFYLYDGAECHLTSPKRKASFFLFLLHFNIRKKYILNIQYMMVELIEQSSISNSIYHKSGEFS